MSGLATLHFDEVSHYLLFPHQISSTIIIYSKAVDLFESTDDVDYAKSIVICQSTDDVECAAHILLSLQPEPASMRFFAEPWLYLLFPHQISSIRIIYSKARRSFRKY